MSPATSDHVHLIRYNDLLSKSDTFGNSISLSNRASFCKDFAQSNTDNTHDRISLSQSTIPDDDPDDSVCEISNKHLVTSLKVWVGRVLLDSSLVDHLVVDDEFSITRGEIVGLFRGDIGILTSFAFSFSLLSIQILSFEIVDLLVRCNFGAMQTMNYLVKDDRQNTRRPLWVGLGLFDIGSRRGQVLLGWVGCSIVRHHLHLGRCLGGLRCSLGFFSSRSSFEFLLQGSLLEVTDRPHDLSGHVVGIFESSKIVFSSNHLVGSLHKLRNGDLDSANEVTGSQRDRLTGGINDSLCGHLITVPQHGR